jgi:hypothetical protein
MKSIQNENLVLLSIADITVGLAIDEANKRHEVRQRYAEFIVDNVDPQVILRIKIRTGARFIPLRAGTWIIELAEAEGRLNYRSHFDAGWVEIDGGRGFLEIAPEADVENFLRVLYAHLVLRAGGLLLHAAGVVRGRTSFVFLGPSGSGKTTAARLSLEHKVLSDDLVIMKIFNDGVRVYGVPFRGELADAPRTNMSAELRGLFTLVKAPEHSVESLPVPIGVGCLMSCAPFVMTDVYRARQALGVCIELARRVPIRALHFRLDSGFWRVLDDY